MSEEKTDDSAVGRSTPKAKEAKEAKEAVVPQDKAIRRTDRRRPVTGLSRLLVAISITIMFLVLLLQPPAADLDTILDQSEHRKTALILTAHPDDEVMFFTPTILALLAAGWEVGALCLSNGNGDGLGKVREEELFKSYEYLGIPPDRVTVLDDPRLQDGMKNHWASSHVSQVLDKHLQTNPASIIITFDPIGITHHPNHIALAHGCSFGPRQSPGQCYALQSPPLAVKFTGPLWAIWYNILTRYSSSFLAGKTHKKTKKRLTIVNTPLGWLKGAVAMSKHRSQLVWFRYLYFAGSRLVWYNELEELLEHG